MGWVVSGVVGDDIRDDWWNVVVWDVNMRSAQAAVHRDKHRELEVRVPVGVLAADLRADMGTCRQMLTLSGYTIGKQKREHPEIKSADYAMVQRIVDGWHIYRQSDTHRIGFAQDDEGQWWAVAWKRTRDDREMLLVHFRRAREYQLHSAARRHRETLQRGRE